MSAIVRVKRRASEDSPNALVIARKKQKLSGDEDKDGTKSVFHLAATVSNKDDPLALSHHVTRSVSKEALKSEYKHHSVNLTEKSRNEQQLVAKRNRYKIVSTLRFKEETESDTLKELSHIFDIEPELDDGVKNTGAKAGEDGICCNGTPMKAEANEEFVYDIYYATDSTFNQYDEDDLLCVEAVDSYFFNDEDYRDYDAIPPEDEDSNDENYYKNEYPDTDPDAGGDSDRELRYFDDSLDIESRMGKFNVTDSNEPASDDEHSVEPYDGVNYAQYKARIMKELREKN